MNRHCVLALVACCLLMTTTAFSQTLPGAGGTLPDQFSGSYDSRRADSPQHLVTITPFGLSSTLCRSLDCIDGSVNFTSVECPSSFACVYTSYECTGSLTQLDDGTVLMTSSPTADGRAVNSEGLCRGLGGTASRSEHTVYVEPPPVFNEAGCDDVIGLFPSVERITVPVGDSYTHGGDAPLVTIVEFTDFQCPYCARSQTVLSELQDIYGSELRFVIKHNPLPFHSDAPLAHSAALAAGAQGQYWEMHNAIFENPRALTRGDLEGHASDLGLDIAAFRAFLDSDTGAAQIAEDQRLALVSGARGTPTFFINGREIRGAQPVSNFRAIIDEELASARAAVAEGFYARDMYECVMTMAGTAAGEPPTRVDPVVAIPDVGSAPTLGPDTAPVQIIEFSDFQCPYCSRATPTIDAVVETFGSQVQVVFMQFPLAFHTNANIAAQASLAAHEQGRFWDYHDVLFENQRALTRADLERYAGDLGLDMFRFRQALDTGRFEAQVSANMAAGTAVGVSGTPSFLINGELLVGAQPIESFVEVINRHLEVPLGAEALPTYKIGPPTAADSAAPLAVVFEDSTPWWLRGHVVEATGSDIVTLFGHSFEVPTASLK